MKNRISRSISILLSVACLLAAIWLQRKPPESPQQVIEPSTKILLTDPPSDDSRKLLERRVAQLDLADAPIDTAVKRLSELTGVPIQIQCEITGDNSVATASKPIHVNIHIKDITLETGLHPILEALAKIHGYPIVLCAYDQCVRIGARERVEQTFTDYFQTQRLCARLLVGATWLTSNAASADWNVQREIEDVLSNNVNPISWRDNGGIQGHASSLGGVLIITQTPENLAAVQPLLDALDRAASPDAPLWQRISTHSTTHHAYGTPHGFINFPPLLERLRLPMELGDVEIGEPARIARQLAFLIADSGGLDSTEANTLLPQVCGRLIVVPPLVDPRDVESLLDGLDRANQVRDLSPVILAKTAAQTRSVFGTYRAIFNVRPLLLGLKRRRVLHPPPPKPPVPLSQRNHEPDDLGLTEYVRSHVDPDKWEGFPSPNFYPMGNLLGLTQTLENIESARRALEQLARELASEREQ